MAQPVPVNTGKVTPIKPQVVQVKPKVALPVELGDLIRFHKHFKQDSHQFEYSRFKAHQNGNELAWKDRKLRTVKADYRFWAFTYEDKNNKTGHGVLFVQGNDPNIWQKLWLKLRPSQPEHKDMWTLKVDEDFQFGQKNKEGEKRFLVLHNRVHTPFQHRFVLDNGFIAGKVWNFMLQLEDWNINVDNADFLWGFLSEIPSDVLKDAIDIAKDATSGALEFVPFAYHAFLIADKVVSFKTRVLGTIGHYLRDFNSGDPTWFDPNRGAVDYRDKIEIDPSAEPVEIKVGDNIDAKPYRLYKIINKTPSRTTNGSMFVDSEISKEDIAKLKGPDGTITVDGTFRFDRLHGDSPQRIIVYSKNEQNLFHQMCYSYALNQASWQYVDVQTALQDLENAKKEAEQAKKEATVANEAFKKSPKDDNLKLMAEAATGKAASATDKVKKAEETAKDAQRKADVMVALAAKKSVLPVAGLAVNALDKTGASRPVLDTIAKHVVRDTSDPLPKFGPRGVSIGDTIKVDRQSQAPTIEIGDKVSGITKYIVMDFVNTDPYRQPKSKVFVAEAKKSAFLAKESNGQIRVTDDFNLVSAKGDDANRYLVFRGDTTAYLQEDYLKAIKPTSTPTIPPPVVKSVGNVTVTAGPFIPTQAAAGNGAATGAKTGAPGATSSANVVAGAATGSTKPTVPASAGGNQIQPQPSASGTKPTTATTTAGTKPAVSTSK